MFSSSLNVFPKLNDILVKKIVLSSFVLCNDFAANSASKIKTKWWKDMDTKWDEPVGFDSKISIYNPIIKQKTKLILQNANLVKWYSCGPTVYDSAHIGHASSYVKLDVIRRILMNIFDLNVFYLMGITDIDDKIILRSNEIKKDFRSLAHRYEIEFFKDLDRLNVLPPTMKVKVSDHITEIISFIRTIVKNGHGYKSPSGSVYFNAEEFPRYGKLYPPQLSDDSSTRDPEKQSQVDFTLWKAAKPHEPHWDSPWGPGRPGWHIECSAMASKVLGPRLDIHSGGQDLVFPHHENEEAQSCAHHNTSQWVNYWIHTGHLSVKGDVKMSKSLKNTISISELLDSYTSNHFRMLCLLSPYRNSIEYSPEIMNTVIGNCRRIESFLDECELYLSGVKQIGVIDEPAVIKKIHDTKELIMVHLADDFDTPRMMDEILRFVSTINTLLNKPVTECASRSVVAVAAASNFVKQILGDLGYTFASKHEGEGDSKRLTAILDSTVNFRSVVRETALHRDLAVAAKPQQIKILQACDELRNSLSDAGVEVKDHHSQKSTWSLKDTVLPKPQ